MFEVARNGTPTAAQREVEMPRSRYAVVLSDIHIGNNAPTCWYQPRMHDAQLVEITHPSEVRDGWRQVLRAQDPDGDPVVLAHADHDQLRRLAVLDIVINNADRKGGHILRAPDGRVVGIDHGVSLNTDDKLRTVLWGWVGQPVPEAEVESLGEVRALMEGDLAERLSEHLTIKEVQAVSARIDRLLEAGVFPEPSGDWPAIPWPAF